MRSVFAFLLLLALLLVPAPASADEGTIAVLLPRLADHAQKLETMKKKASCSVVGSMDELDGSGNVAHKKDLSLKLTSDGQKSTGTIVSFWEDGQDKTAEAKTKAAAEAQKPKKKDSFDFHLPFLASEQGKYTFTGGESDPKDAMRIRVYFTPKAAAEDLYTGSAWVDSRSGTVLTIGFKLSKNPTFVDFVNVTMEFNAPTSIGPALSKVSFEAKGSFLFIKKHLRGSATLSNFTIAP